MKRSLALTSILLTLTAACGGGGEAEDDQPTEAAESVSSSEAPGVDFTAAHDECVEKLQEVIERVKFANEMSGSGFLQLEDEGATLLVVNPATHIAVARQLTSEAARCVLRSVSAPASIMAKMDQASELDGTVVDSWDGAEASWSFDAAEGLSVVFSAD